MENAKIASVNNGKRFALFWGRRTIFCMKLSNFMIQHALRYTKIGPRKDKLFFVDFFKIQQLTSNILTGRLYVVYLIF